MRILSSVRIVPLAPQMPVGRLVASARQIPVLMLDANMQDLIVAAALDHASGLRLDRHTEATGSKEFCVHRPARMSRNEAILTVVVALSALALILWL
ncbi:MAG TPA: hypothetical protein EYP56_14650 [Planctomycetaceae bacterium]|nr:hypothetical protein [Planctomycetaceae bacterium]